MRIRGCSQSGFSLLEVLVAFSIMALSLGALYSALGGSVRGAMQADRQVRAAIAAESILALYESVPRDGLDVSGTEADGLSWTLRSSPAPAPGGNTEPPWRLHRVEVTVGWSGSPGFRIATLLPERPELLP